MSDELTKEKLYELSEQWLNEARMDVIRQCDALLDAGWKFELPGRTQSEAWQWYWRRPPRRGQKRGRLFLSTNQAFAYLRRAQGREPEISV